MCCGYPYEILTNKCLDLNKACKLHFIGAGKLFVLSYYEFQHLFICYIHFLTHSSSFCFKVQVSLMKYKSFT